MCGCIDRLTWLHRPNNVRLHRPSSMCGCMDRLSWLHRPICATAWADFIACGCIDRLITIICDCMGRLYCVRLHRPSLFDYYAAALAVFNAFGCTHPKALYYNNHKTKSCCVLAAPTLASKRPRLWLTTWLNGYCSL